MIQEPLVSVILPVYNGQAYIGEAIESVLSGSYRNIEMVVVDDGSTDETAKIVEQFVPKICYFYQSNQGASAARNAGINKATGEYFAFIDADDLWTNDKLTRQMMEFQRDPALDAVSGMVEQFYNLGQETFPDTKTYAGYLPGSLLIKRQSFLQVGFFQPGLQLGEVVDWFCRFRQAKLKISMLPFLIYKRRIHRNNQGVTKQRHRVEYARILKAALDRRRAQSTEESQ